VTSEDARQAVLAWVEEAIPELEASYDHVPSGKGALPDVIVEATRTGIEMGGGERFACWQLQQRAIYFVECSVSFMVDNSDTKAAASLLHSIEERLVAGVLADATLGSRVPFASPLVEFDFTTPFVEYEDGTRGREMTMTLAVGDLVEAP